MHVLHVYKEYIIDSFGGIQQTIRHLAKGLLKNDVKVSIVTLSRAVKSYTVAEHEGITVHTHPLLAEVYSNGISLSAMRHYRALARTADVLHYHYPWPSGDILHQFAPKSIPTVVTYHSDIVRQKFLNLLYTPLRERFLGQMDALVATSPNYMESSQVLRRYADKTSCIPIGLDETLYPTPTEELLSQWKAKLPPHFFLYVGVLRYYKGLHILVEAARRSGQPIVIVGYGPLAQELERQAADIPNLTFLGEVSEADKMALFRLSSAFVFPSHLRSEAFGISLLEAAMMGKPMISCEIGTGTTYINKKDETGLVIQPSDPAQLVTAMKTLNDDPALCETMGRAARARYEALFTADVMASRYLELYKNVIAKKRSAQPFTNIL